MVIIKIRFCEWMINGSWRRPVYGQNRVWDIFFTVLKMTRQLFQSENIMNIRATVATAMCDRMPSNMDPWSIQLSRLKFNSQKFSITILNVFYMRCATKLIQTSISKPKINFKKPKLTTKTKNHQRKLTFLYRQNALPPAYQYVRHAKHTNICTSKDISYQRTYELFLL